MIYSYNPLHTHPQTEMVGQEPSEHTVSLCWKPENNTRCSTRTITNIEILESHFEPNHQEGFHPSVWASWCILSCQLYTPQCHLLAKNFHTVHFPDGNTGPRDRRVTVTGKDRKTAPAHHHWHESQEPFCYPRRRWEYSQYIIHHPALRARRSCPGILNA